ncbi:hypothetical protein D0469_20470 [Peribacillus saganii]|uniref:RNA polymerase sigma factor 70 region 4 type 2 domain-containing protein n=1 Tax=Peribacillus saganii TaxID=2303992 RepID=A0A372LAH2_9BACI|nr:sigma factor-like helix-turn-helix DNA-binding protein [Peribacillus saganii]RFU62619.1 hypothetical protein D0469_20470 [Peribacillus saganii]
MHDLHYQEASDILELKLNTFKSHLSRGRKKLKKFAAVYFFIK